MNAPTGEGPTRPGWLAKLIEKASNAAAKWAREAFASAASWAEEAFNAATAPTTELRREQRAFVVAILTLALLLFGLICCGVAWLAILLTATKTLPGVPSGIPLPGVYFWPLVTVFVIYGVVLHRLACGLAEFGENALQAMEYVYLLLAAAGFSGVLSVGIDQAISAKRFYESQLEEVRSEFDHRIEYARAELCDERGPKLPPLQTEFCQWLGNATSLAHQRIERKRNQYGNDDLTLIDMNIEEYQKSVHGLIQHGEELVGRIPKEPSPFLTDNQKWGLNDFDGIVQVAKSDFGFKYFWERGGWIAKIDAIIKENEEKSYGLTKLFSALLLAFAIALRISKLSAETFEWIRK